MSGAAVHWPQPPSPAGKQSYTEQFENSRRRAVIKCSECWRGQAPRHGDAGLLSLVSDSDWRRLVPLSDLSGQWLSAPCVLSPL